MSFRMLGSRLAAPVLGAALCVGVAVPASAAGGSPAAVGGSAVGVVSPQLTPPAITRTEMLQRAASWVGLGLQYNGNGSHDGYRTDCSGYVSMAWDLGQSLVTGQFAPGTVTEGITKSELRPGDALNNPAAGSAGHIVMFDKWTDSSQTSYWGYEFTGSGVHHRTIPYPYFSGYGTFSPVRDRSVVDVTDPGMKNLAAVGDQTGDGIPDIIGTEVSTGKLFRYAGPAYSGVTRVQIGTGWNVYDSITAVGDLTGDGVSDIVAYGGDGKLYRYSGPGYAGGTKVQIGTGWNTMANVTAVGDLTGDGVPDIIAVEKSSGKLFRYAGPDFSGATRTQIGTGWNIYDSITAVGDQNGDGITDIIAYGGDGNLYRYSGPDYAGGSKIQLGVSWDAMNDLVSPGDLTGDGIPDLLAVDLSTSHLYRYSGPGFVGGASRVQIGTGW